MRIEPITPVFQTNRLSKRLKPFGKPCKNYLKWSDKTIYNKGEKVSYQGLDYVCINDGVIGSFSLNNWVKLPTTMYI